MRQKNPARLKTCKGSLGKNSRRDVMGKNYMAKEKEKKKKKNNEDNKQR